jgi:hypothetical protein
VKPCQCGSNFLLVTPQPAADVTGGLRVERDCRFIQQQDARIIQDCLGKRNRHFLACRQCAAHPVEIWLDLESSRQHHDSLPELPDAVEAGMDAKMLAHCQTLREVDTGR